MSLQIFYNRKSVIYTHIVNADADGVGDMLLPVWVFSW